MKKAYGFLVWFISTLYVVYAFCLNTAAAVFSDSIKTSLHVTNIDVAYAVAAFTVGFALMQIPGGYLLDRFNIRWIASIGVFLLALGNLCISYADNLTLFILSNLLQGAGGSFAFTATGVLISKWFPNHYFPVLFGSTQTISCILSGIVHYLFKVALNVYSWNFLYKNLSIFGFFLFVLTLLTIKVPKDDKTIVISFGKSVKQAFKNGQIWLCAISAATTFGVLLAYASFWYINVQKFYSVSTDNAFIISAIIFVGIGLGTPFFGAVSNFVKSRKSVIHVTLTLGNMALLLAVYSPHFSFNNLILIDIISFFSGFLLSGSMLFYTIISEISSDNTRGVALSLINTCVFLFNTLLLLFPYLFITQTSTLFFTYLWILPFCVMISILLLYFVKDTYR